MRAAILLLVSVALSSAARGETLRLPPAAGPQADKALPLKGTGSGSAKADGCAAYGRGFRMVEGTGTCVKIGGAISVDAAVRR
ncbi:hypothetical protein G8O24_30600 [Bradyrhizobium sp. INPA01-394B]|uniref:Porin n=1 Tax=Bradyrhizobium campsiandrae TaxID=1729892 RepID=A0ABR7U7G2_9BRAD|nr:porin [Bradyrhizobium campsiandrae]MBC9881679.1 hypothetical protein [Bradyrhizobium campsiandrae]MBC9979476.1 porin [Bradyrhizobium campsiandrae]